MIRSPPKQKFYRADQMQLKERGISAPKFNPIWLTRDIQTLFHQTHSLRSIRDSDWCMENENRKNDEKNQNSFNFLTSIEAIILSPMAIVYKIGVCIVYKTN